MCCLALSGHHHHHHQARPEIRHLTHLPAWCSLATWDWRQWWWWCGHRRLEMMVTQTWFSCHPRHHLLHLHPHLLPWYTRWYCQCSGDTIGQDFIMIQRLQRDWTLSTCTRQTYITLHTWIQTAISAIFPKAPIVVNSCKKLAPTPWKRILLCLLLNICTISNTLFCPHHTVTQFDLNILKIKTTDLDSK